MRVLNNKWIINGILIIYIYIYFKWKYNTGNSWGTDPITNKSGIGLGPQEQFYGKVFFYY